MLRAGGDIPLRLREIALLFPYVATVFVSAALLFVLQPLFARMALPLLGGSPAVWNTALVFYQALLLVGYGYAHLTTRWLGPRRQSLVHAVVLLLPLAVLPIAIPAGWPPPPSANPIPWFLALMTVAIGLPLFVVSTTGPLLQRWFSVTGHPDAGDPYFLYAASNLGSMLGLLAYPFLIEPGLTLTAQGRLWSTGYVLFAALALVCAVALWRLAPAVPGLGPAAVVEPRAAASAAPPPALTVRRRLRWVLLAFIPSSLMLGVTMHLTTDIAAMPLLWVLPLAIYLLTFILVFARRALIPRNLALRALPIAVLLLVIVLVSRANEPVALVMGIQLALLFIAGLVCHGELARDRPAPAQLTEFYLWLAVGGVLGGVFNALVAPLLFDSILEYPIVVVLLCLAAPPIPERDGTTASPEPRVGDLLWPLGIGLLTLALIRVTTAVGAAGEPAAVLIVFGLPLLLCFGCSRRPLRFGLAVGAVLLAGASYDGGHGTLLHAERSFFGVHRVTLDPSGQFHYLFHGSTLHGIQAVDPVRRGQPLSYYHREGPIGQALLDLVARVPRPRIAMVGLGAGDLMGYARAGQDWTAYEIDPAVERIARDGRYFTYLGDAPVPLSVVLGDARLSLAADAGAEYDLMVLDAYTSDSVPVHLLTREALQVYLSRLAPHGVLLFHLSNRHLDLAPVVAGLAADAGLVFRLRDDLEIPGARNAVGRQAARAAVVARSLDDLGPLATDPRWVPLPVAHPIRPWTDDYSSLVGVLRGR